ncbi:MAG TPA: XrtA system polysaccharide deacetylase [Candidatus Eisenbacteria bacterium]|nr:XrtA system polysaccharide deacetylase [Candidatus Eisenbacteria bacterium]
MNENDSKTAAEPRFAMSVDVEEHFQVQAFATLAPRESWPLHPSRVDRNTRRLLDLFDESGTEATFFTLGCVAKAHPALVREIVARGHEIASHGMDHRMLTELTPEAFRLQARDSRSLLEDLTGARVLGYRAPSYSVGRTTLWAIDELAASGYAYDSSIYPIRRRRYGYPEGPVVPALIRGPGGATLPEFPLPTLSFGPIRLPVLAGAFLRLFPLSLSRFALDRHRAAARPMVVNVHPWELDPDQPTIGSSRRATWTHYARLDRVEGILRALLSRATFRSASTRLMELGLLRK